MGGSSYSNDFYKARVDDRAARGVPTFDYSARVSSGAAPKVAHDTLNVHGKIREARDSKEHPNSTPIMIIFDVTGSMAGVPVQMQKKLPQLMGLLLRKAYIEDPQILFGAVGDYFADSIPMQAGQFESGIEMDDNLTNVVLEGGGGGTFEESYQNALYFAAHRTSCDAFEKRGKKGYLFLIGDEKPYPQSTKEELSTLLGVTVQQDVPLEDIVAAAKEKWEVFFIIPAGTQHAGDASLLKRWTGLLGQNVIQLKDPDAVCETIGLTIGLLEGTANADLAKDLKDVGTADAIVHVAATAVDAIAKNAALMKVGTGGSLPSKAGRSEKTERL